MISKYTVDEKVENDNQCAKTDTFADWWSIAKCALCQLLLLFKLHSWSVCARNVCTKRLDVCAERRALVSLCECTLTFPCVIPTDIGSAQPVSSVFIK